MKTNSEIIQEIEFANSQEELDRILNTISSLGIDINRLNDYDTTIIFHVFWNLLPKNANSEENRWKLTTLLEQDANPLLGQKPAIYNFERNVRLGKLRIFSLLCEYGGGLTIRTLSREEAELFADALVRGAENKTQQEMCHEIDARHREETNLRKTLHAKTQAIMDGAKNSVTLETNVSQEEREKLLKNDFWYDLRKMIAEADARNAKLAASLAANDKTMAELKAKHDAEESQEKATHAKAVDEMKTQYEKSELLLAARRRSQPKQITWVFSGLQFASLLKNHIDSVETNDIWLPHAESIMNNLLAASQCPISRPNLAPAALTALDEVKNYEANRFRVIEETLLTLNSTSKHYAPFPKEVIGICFGYLANRALTKVRTAPVASTTAVRSTAAASTDAATVTTSRSAATL